MTRVLCRVESGRLGTGRGASLVGIIDQLDRFHGAVTGRLDAMTRLSHEVVRIGAGLSDRRPGARLSSAA
jgi:hypothetical protein